MKSNMFGISKKSGFAALVLLAVVSCKEEALYTPGEEEDPNSYGVYFPAQTSPTEIELEPGDETVVTYKVRRSNYVDGITVPVSVEASEEGIFDIEPIVFEPGEQETEFTVSFDDAEIGMEYSCSIKVEDARYISIYGKRSTTLSFSVSRVGWNRVLGAQGETTGKWRDNIVSNMYSVSSSSFNRYPEIDVEIYEREDQDGGFYRMKVYGEDLMTELVGTTNINFTSRDSWTTIDASDPQKVFIPYQSTGLSVVTEDGEIRIASYVPENFSMDESAAQYGTLENGIITFPAQSIMLEASSNSGSYYYGNREGMLRIILPGYVAPDYSVSLTGSEPADGVVEISATLAADVQAFRYCIFEGSLDDGTASIQAQEMDNNKDFDGSLIPSETGSTATIRIENMATGKYTLVGCAYDSDGLMREYAFIPFGYIAAGDSRPIVLTFGLEATNEYAGQGINPDNSAKFYAWGEEIESVTYGLFRTDRIASADYDSLLDEEGTDFTASELEELNDGHFSVMLSGLNGASSYTLVLRANNGYVTRIMTEEITTTGVFNPALEVFYYEDFLSSDQQPTLEQMIGTKWNYYAYNFNDEDAVRRKIGTVTMSVNEELSEDNITLLNITGLSGIEFEEGGDLIGGYMPYCSVFTGYNGALALSVGVAERNIYEGNEVTIGFINTNDLYVYYSQAYYMFFGAVADGYLYCVPSPIYLEYDYNFAFLFTGAASQLYSLMGEMLLVDPEKDLGGLPSAALSRIAMIRKAALHGFRPERMTGHLELGPVGKGYERPALNLAVNPIPASAPTVKRAEVIIK